MGVNRFRTAQPNEGYKLAAALLRERALSCVLTLNFDLAMSTALGSIGADDVAIVQGPEDHGRIGAFNLIYLHRNANCDVERWILTTRALTAEWHDQWEEVIARRFIGGPITVFAGLGSPAAVLLQTTQRIRAAVAAALYQIDPADRESCQFFRLLALPAAAYLQMGWSAFMQKLSRRVLDEHVLELRDACAAVVESQGLPAENVTQVCHALRNEGLLGLGQLRARWLLLNPA
jgi:hypothetical protein